MALERGRAQRLPTRVPQPHRPHRRLPPAVAAVMRGSWADSRPSRRAAGCVRAPGRWSWRDASSACSSGLHAGPGRATFQACRRPPLLAPLARRDRRARGPGRRPVPARSRGDGTGIAVEFIDPEAATRLRRSRRPTVPRRPCAGSRRPDRHSLATRPLPSPARSRRSLEQRVIDGGWAARKEAALAEMAEPGLGSAATATASSRTAERSTASPRRVARRLLGRLRSGASGSARLRGLPALRLQCRRRGARCAGRR